MVELSWEVARHLPYLRRYARAITGDPDRGDASIRACLESLLPEAVDLANQNVRLELYRALHAVWSRCAGGTPDHGPMPPLMEDRSIVAARVGCLGPAQRQMLVLTALEGFALPEAAAVMGLSLPAAAALLRRAREELRSQKPSRILIIEDEPVIALDIASTVRESGHRVVGIAATHRNAVDVADREEPELILADIQLADNSSGLEAVQEILRERRVPVVFITAFPERLLTGVRPEPTFLVTKPFDAETLRVSISQALSVEAPARQLALQ
jgi:CheY-like chemotaxis protein/DNA-directed RNA polymerase specialized sigma24 family protein